MKIKNLIIGMMFLFMLIPFISAVNQPTQQFNKLFLSPFYLQETTKDEATFFTITINPPDNIKNVISSLVNFDIWLNPSVEFTLLVNGMPCNNPTYYVDTSYANAGKNIISFDCSNVIIKSGTYTFELRATRNTGALTGWLDLTYMNNPIGEVSVFSTEYSPNDLATIFLQLKDNQGSPVLDGACYLDIYSPLVNATHSFYLNDASMLLSSGETGVYYYDLTTPSTLGVYMLSASCSYSYDGGYIYYLSGDTEYPSRTIIAGTYEGSAINLNGYEDGLYVKCNYQLVGGQKVCEAYYDFNTTIHFPTMTNITNMDLYYMGETSTSVTGNFYVWNWTDSTWIILPNSVVYSGTASSTQPSGANDYVANPLPLTDIINSTDGIIRIRHYLTSPSIYYLWNNWLNIKVLTAEGIVQDIKGSSEMHVTDIPQATADLVQNLTLNVNTTPIATAVWEYDNRSITETNNIASAIWGWTGSISSSILNFFTSDIWSFTNRSLSEGEYQKISQYVWSYGDRNLTFYEVNDISPEDVWQYTSRNLTFTEDVTNYSQVAEYVWLYVDRNLTTEYINNISVEDIWTYYNRSLTDDIPLQIWSYQERNLTTDIPFDVWSYHNRTLTYYTLNLTELIDMINEYEFSQIEIPLFSPTDEYPSYTLNVVLYIEK